MTTSWLLCLHEPDHPMSGVVPHEIIPQINPLAFSRPGRALLPMGLLYLVCYGVIEPVPCTHIGKQQSVWLYVSIYYLLKSRITKVKVVSIEIFENFSIQWRVLHLLTFGQSPPTSLPLWQVYAQPNDGLLQLACPSPQVRPLNNDLTAHSAWEEASHRHRNRLSTVIQLAYVLSSWFSGFSCSIFFLVSVCMVI